MQMRRSKATQPDLADPSDLTRAGTLERLVFIDFRCLFLGEFNRSDLMERFGVSSAAATRDIAYYRNQLGGQIEFDAIRKAYRIKANFSPVFEHDVRRALTALSRGFGESQAIRTRPPLLCETPPELSRPGIEILAQISRAIYGTYPVSVRYSSFSSGVTTREIVPFALANNGLRWHVRAFDRRRQKFIDFVLTRFHEVEELSDKNIEDHERPEHDIEWGRLIELELVPHPKEPHPEIVEMDYAMKDGVLRVRVRAALASYLLRHWIVDCSPEHDLTGIEYRLWLRNSRALYGVANARLAPGYPVDEEN